MIKYSLNQINKINTGASLSEDELSTAKYAKLLTFIGTFNKGNLNRNLFGQQVTKSYFNKAITHDEIIISKINEIMGKITETNYNDILKQLLDVPFEKAVNLSQIAKIIHMGVINCSKFNKLFVALFKHIYENHSQLIPFLRDEMLLYDQSQMDSLMSSFQEEKLIIKNRILANYEMLILLIYNEIAFNFEDMYILLRKLIANVNVSQIELAIRLVIIMQKQYKNDNPQIRIPIELKDQIRAQIKEQSYPNMIKFLIMEME